jgi:hypothetical protein|tara:strand:+ start:4042 stop:4335 length:294 start_codon:yes stop_codon:yes gene_type:complete
MQKKKSTARGLKVGDLVYHLLYGKKWVGILLEIIDVYENDARSKNHRELGLVKMQPGTQYETFFEKMVSRQSRISDSLGFVSTNWLFKLEEADKERD